MPSPTRRRAPRPSIARVGLACALALATAAASCDRDAIDEPLPEPPAPPATERDNVDARLLPYFDRYEAEAARRGIAVDLTAVQLTAHVVEIDEDGVAGECTYDPSAPNRLVVDEALWDQTDGGTPEDDLLREYVVFHELGHCERLRAHREDRNPEGRCVSLMASGVGDCRPSYGASNRDLLLDELFDETFYGDGF